MSLITKLTTVVQAIGADVKSLTNGLATKLTASNNLSDVSNAGTARTNLGLGNVSNVSAADLRNRATHTGTQAISTVSGLQSALDGKAALSHTHNASDINAGTLADARLPVSQVGKTFTTPIHVNNTFNTNGTGPGQQQDGFYLAELGSVGTTLNPAFTLGIVGQTGINRSIALTVDSNGYLWGYRSHSSAATYTFQSKSKLADALTNARLIGGVSFNGTGNINLPGVNIAGNQNTSGNAATATALQNARLIAGKSFDGTADVTLTAADVGAASASHTHTIANVTGLQSALDGKEPSITGGTTAQFWRGDKTFTAVTKANVGLGSVDNVSAANLRNRATHTGSQTISTITNLQTTLDGKLEEVNDADLVAGQKVWHLIQDTVSVKMFGAVGDGVTDDTTAISNAINFAGNKKIIFPAGTYRITSQIDVLSSDIWLAGDGEGVTILEFTPTNTQYMFKIGATGSGNGRNNVRISGFIFKKVGTPMSGSGGAVLVENSHNIRLDHIRVWPGFYHGFHFHGGAEQFLYYLSDFEIDGCTGSGIFIHGYAQDVWIRSGIIAGCDAGLWTRHASGIYVDSIDMLSCDHSIRIAPQSGEESRLFWFNQVIADSSDSHGWLFNPASGGKVMGINLSNCWAASTLSALGTGMLFTGAGTIHGFNATNFRAMSNAGAAIVLDNGVGIDFVNAQVSRNSIGSTNEYSGFVIGSGVAHWSIIGGVAGAHGTWEAATQKHGILFQPGAQSSFRVIGVNLEGNLTSGINNKAHGGVITDCTGYVTDTLGGLQLDAGNTSFTVNHNLGYVPFLEEINTWPVVNIRDADITHWWVDNVTTTTFRFNVSGTWGGGGGPSGTTWWGWRYTRVSNKDSV